MNYKIIEYQNIRVLTTQQLAEAYGTTDKVVSNNFNYNKCRYVKGKHYIMLQGEELKEFKSKSLNLGIAQNVGKLYLWTEKGAFLHAKSLNTDAAWEVYERLVDSYFQKPQNPLTDREMMRIQLGMYDEHEERISHLENTMNLDYGQQQELKNAVNKQVITVLGGKKSNAYLEIGKKVFSECNHDIQDYFNVNSRNNIPRLRFAEAMEYVRGWEPGNNTKIAIRICNDQSNLVGSANGV